MLSLKTNKGFTLVELLVSMCILAIVMTELMALMFNSSKLYQNGAFEVSLQSEAQQIIQQFEELAIDADTSVSFNEATKTITVSNNSPYDSYEFTLSPVAGKPYNDLMLKVNGGTPQIMGEYVKSISLNMSNFDDASRAVLIVEMENDKYSYSAAKDIYFRNDIGANDMHTSAVVSESCNYSLNVLRFAKYDLKSLYNSTDYVYAFDVEPHSEYSYTGPTKVQVEAATSQLSMPCEVWTSISMNSTGGDHLHPEYKVIAYKWDSSASKYVSDYTIKLYSEEVMFGFDGAGFAYHPAGTSTNFDNYYSVQGVSIDPANISSLDLQLCCVADVNASQVTANDLEIKVTSGSSASVTFTDQNWSRQVFVVDTFKTVTGSDLASVINASPNSPTIDVNSYGASLLHSHNLKLFSTKFSIDKDNNDFVCINGIQYNSGDTTQWNDFIYNYATLCIKVNFNYSGSMAPSGGRTFELRIYPYPKGSDEYPTTPQDVRGRFCDIAK